MEWLKNFNELTGIKKIPLLRKQIGHSSSTSMWLRNRSPFYTFMMSHNNNLRIASIQVWSTFAQILYFFANALDWWYECVVTFQHAVICQRWLNLATIQWAKFHNVSEVWCAVNAGKLQSLTKCMLVSILSIGYWLKPWLIQLFQIIV